jgi:hypothetical protein
MAATGRQPGIRAAGVGGQTPKVPSGVAARVGCAGRGVAVTDGEEVDSGGGIQGRGSQWCCWGTEGFGVGGLTDGGRFISWHLQWADPFRCPKQSESVHLGRATDSASSFG